MHKVPLVQYDLGLHADASPQVAQGMIKPLGANGACDGRAPGSFSSGRRLSIAALHSSVSLATSVDGKGRLLLMMPLMYLGIRRYMQDVH